MPCNPIQNKKDLGHFYQVNHGKISFRRHSYTHISHLLSKRIMDSCRLKVPSILWFPLFSKYTRIYIPYPFYLKLFARGNRILVCNSHGVCYEFSWETFRRANHIKTNGNTHNIICKDPWLFLTSTNRCYFKNVIALFACMEHWVFVVFWKDGLLAELQAQMFNFCYFCIITIRYPKWRWL